MAACISYKFQCVLAASCSDPDVDVTSSESVKLESAFHRPRGASS